MTGSVVNFNIFPNIVVVPNLKHTYEVYTWLGLYTFGLDRQWAIATSTVKYNYFQLALLVISLNHNHLSHAVGVSSDLSRAGAKNNSFLHGPAISVLDGKMLLLRSVRLVSTMVKMCKYVCLYALLHFE